ncbi:MAG: DUF3791 domain-containing protein [Clostridia bacterium]|nr:DUF3791 domain-containing protein [Clostridia bacterium]
MKKNDVKRERFEHAILLYFICCKVCARIEEEGLEDKEALASLYNSQMRAALEQESTNLWKLDPKDLYDMYREEQETGGINLEKALNKAALVEDTFEDKLQRMDVDHDDCLYYRKEDEPRVNDEADYAILAIELYCNYRNLTGKAVMDLFYSNGMLEYLLVIADALLLVGLDFAMKQIDKLLEEKGVKFEKPGRPFH